HGHRAAGDDDPRSEPLVYVADRDRQKRAGDVVHGDRRRHGGRRPAMQPLERGDVDADSVETEAEAEQRHDERGADDVPAIEVTAAHAVTLAAGSVIVSPLSDAIVRPRVLPAPAGARLAP